LAAQYREEITALEAQAQQLQEKASEFYTKDTEPLKEILATVVLDRESWQGDSLVTEESFPDQITHISKRLLGPGIRGNVHVTPLHQRTFIPLGSLQPVARMAAVPLARDSVVGDLPEIGSLPSGPQAAGAASAAAEQTLDYPDKTPDEDGIPNDLSPNQRTFVKAIITKEALNFAQASNVAGLSPSSTKKVITDITKKWPEFPKFIESYISVAENE
jgi:lambda repressor-like predicted transcriptional regulator